MTTTEALPVLQDTLVRRSSPTGRVLSVYLDTSPEHSVRDSYLWSFIDGCKQLRDAVAAEERVQFEAAVAQAERYLRREFQPGPRGIAVFASGDPDYFYATTLPVVTADVVAWEEHAVIAPLHELLDDMERVGVLLVDKERARIFTVFLGAIESRLEFADEVPGKQATGGWYSLAQTRIARRHEDHVRRHITRTNEALLDVLRERPFERLFVAGPVEALSMLRRYLPRTLQTRLAGVLSLPVTAPEETVVGTVLEAAEAAERREEQLAVDALIAGRTDPQVRLGVEPVVAALNERVARRLVVADHLSVAGAACPNCGMLADHVARCTACGTEMQVVTDLRERVTEVALAQGADVEFVAGAAAEQLQAHGGMGAWVYTR